MEEWEMKTRMLENEKIRITVLPEDGGRIVSLLDRAAGCELLWENLRTSRARRYYGCCYDDMSAGGVEEAFPTVEACRHARAELPPFGEVWTLAWQAEQEDNCLVLETKSLVWPAAVRKTITLDGACVHIMYRIENIGTDTFSYIFGFHPALRLYKDSILMQEPGCYRMYCAPDLSQGQELFSWPMFHGRDLRQIQTGKFGGVYNFGAYPAAVGCYGVRHPAEKTSLQIRFDASFFRSLSIWPVYGSWRGHTCLLTEAFTCLPLKLTQAEQETCARHLNSGESIQTNVSYIVGL